MAFPISANDPLRHVDRPFETERHKKQGFKIEELSGTGKNNIYIIYIYIIYIPWKSIWTKLCPLVGFGILYMDHPKDHSLFGLGLPGYIYIFIFISFGKVTI